MNTAWPSVSVVVPAHNAQATLGQALCSVFWQGYPGLDVWVVDDGSTDATSDCVRQFQAQGHPVQLLQQPQQGSAAARNQALAQARGEFIAFLDADDLWLPGKLHAQVAYLLAHPEVDVVFGRFQRWEATPAGLWPAPPPQALYQQAAQAWPTPSAGRPPSTAAPSGSLYADLLLDSVVHIITALVRRPVFNAVGGFDERLRTGQDYDFWLRASRHCRMDQLDQGLAWYRIHPHSITRQPRPRCAEYDILLQHLAEHGPTGPDGRTVPPQVLQQRLFGICFGHGYHNFWHGQPAYARRAFAQALRHRRWHGKTWVYWLLSCLRAPFLSASHPPAKDLTCPKSPSGPSRG